MISRATHFKVNKKPVGLGRAVELKEKNPRKRVVKLSGKRKSEMNKYNVYQERKGM